MLTASEMGKKGMAARLRKMSKQERQKQASLGGKARWAGISKQERQAYARKIRKAKQKKKARIRSGAAASAR